MTLPRSALDRLLSPIRTSDFFREYWEKSVFVRQGNAVNDEVLTESDLDALLAQNDVRSPALRIAKDGFGIPLSRYSSILRYGPYAAEGLIDQDRVFRELSGGATVICQLLQTSVPRTSRFVSELSGDLGFRVDAHAFITPKESRGLTTHYDTTSSFILQIGGRKSWKLFEPVRELPTVDQIFDETKDVSFKQVDEVVLEKGDMLYLPRGVPHCAQTLNTYSVHATLVMFAPTWIDILKRALANCAADPLFRGAPRPNDDWSLDIQTKLLQKFDEATWAAIEATPPNRSNL